MAGLIVHHPIVQEGVFYFLTRWSSKKQDTQERQQNRWYQNANWTANRAQTKTGDTWRIVLLLSSHTTQ
jgi:hypothetical protein